MEPWGDAKKKNCVAVPCSVGRWHEWPESSGARVAFRGGGERLASTPRCKGSHVVSWQFPPECRSDGIQSHRQRALCLSQR
jgi:hypothetical protein